jgi:hypothetical protein
MKPLWQQTSTMGYQNTADMQMLTHAHPALDARVDVVGDNRTRRCSCQLHQAAS